MADFGVVATGFNLKRQPDIQKSIEDRHRAAFGELIDVAIATELGQLDGNISSELAECWEVLEICYNAFDPEAANELVLAVLASLTGTVKRNALPSTVVYTVNLNAGATVNAGSLVSIPGRPDILFALDGAAHNAGGSAADITLNTLGGPLTATATVTGPIAVPAGLLSVIVTASPGWNNGFNPVDATVGRNVDSDIQLRQRRFDELALRGGSTLRALKADLLDVASHPELAGIESVEALENTGDAPDSNGLPGHSFEIVLDDGASPTVADNAIAQSIFDSGPAGIFSSGTTLASATDENGDAQPERFTRVSRLTVYVSLTLVRTADYPTDGDTQVKAAIVAKGSELLAGQEVVALALRAAALEVAGVHDVTAYTQGLSPGPVLSANLPIGVRERATFSTVNVVVS